MLSPLVCLKLTTCLCISGRASGHAFENDAKVREICTASYTLPVCPAVPVWTALPVCLQDTYTASSYSRGVPLGPEMQLRSNLAIPRSLLHEVLGSIPGRSPLTTRNGLFPLLRSCLSGTIGLHLGVPSTRTHAQHSAVP